MYPHSRPAPRLEALGTVASLPGGLGTEEREVSLQLPSPPVKGIVASFLADGHFWSLTAPMTTPRVVG